MDESALLLQAVFEGDVKNVIRIVETYKIDLTQDLGREALIAAKNQRHVSIEDYLISQGAKDTTSFIGGTSKQRIKIGSNSCVVSQAASGSKSSIGINPDKGNIASMRTDPNSNKQSNGSRVCIGGKNSNKFTEIGANTKISVTSCRGGTSVFENFNVGNNSEVFMQSNEGNITAQDMNVGNSSKVGVNVKDGNVMFKNVNLGDNTKMGVNKESSSSS